MTRVKCIPEQTINGTHPAKLNHIDIQASDLMNKVCVSFVSPARGRTAQMITLDLSRWQAPEIAAALSPEYSRLLVKLAATLPHLAGVPGYLMFLAVKYFDTMRLTDDPDQAVDLDGFVAAMLEDYPAPDLFAEYPDKIG